MTKKLDSLVPFWELGACLLPMLVSFNSGLLIQFSPRPKPVPSKSEGVVIGQGADGSVKLMMTMEDTAEIICYLESTKHALLSNGLTED